MLSICGALSSPAPHMPGMAFHTDRHSTWEAETEEIRSAGWAGVSDVGPHLRTPKARKGVGQRPCQNEPKAVPVLCCLSPKINCTERIVMSCLRERPGTCVFLLWVMSFQGGFSAVALAQPPSGTLESPTDTCPQACRDHPRTYSTHKCTGTRECTPQNERIRSAA